MEFSQLLSAKNILRIHPQIDWGIKVCYMRRKFDHCRDLLLKSPLLPAAMNISKFSLLKLRTDLNQSIASENVGECADLPQL